MKIFLIFLTIASLAFSQYHYSPANRVGNVRPFVPSTAKNAIPLYPYKNDLSKPRFANPGYTKSYYRNGRFHYFGSGYMSYWDRQKLRDIDGRYSPRYRMLENQMRINNSTIKSQIHQRNPNNNVVNSAVNDNFRIEMEMQMIRTLRELDINRHFK
ncbi:hypothetical protein A966_03925 [Brachyspira hampsonii 30446]|uniref:Uncharacterized protein n=1 Tax=Brachyspira hampsonii 30446 TaxID=1289135 RepID=A0A2U4FK75_9SPIR|nr:hypothetical protein [Brachyspira hampsonii]EKV57711.1 hypothetical protein A966_03925 [Brachyspira hampsonii 30446]MBW5394725.1 hypothetical protein [Brachyspira hampsonii]OEJ16991.1 hypothetical protein A9495_08325 [Brachyspira hampsonii]